MASVLRAIRLTHHSHIKQLQPGIRKFSGVSTPPRYTNEPILSFLPDSRERSLLKQELEALRESGPVKVPLVVGGVEIHTEKTAPQKCPYEHERVVAEVSLAEDKHVTRAIQAALIRRKEWELTPFERRAAVLLKAADLLAGKYRYKVLAATMAGQGKTVFQAEIDATCELIDFFRFGVQYAQEIYSNQPQLHSPGVWNRLEYRGLEGFVAAISPFNFTAIGGNLGATPALMGNVVLWKPAQQAVLSNWVVFQALREAGLPDGVVNFLPSTVPLFGDMVLSHPDLAALNFTGSSRTLKQLWKQVGNNIERYKTFPRIVGEAGGKNYHLVHETADVDTVVNGTIRSAFEYSGQKCSACSRLYIPRPMWEGEVKEKLVEAAQELKFGSPEDFTTFSSAVIDEQAFDRIEYYINYARKSPDAQILVGGGCDKKEGYFVEPTIVVTRDPNHKLMREEIFGPVLTVYVYESEYWEGVMKLVEETSPYALTGSLYAGDSDVITQAAVKLRDSAGNFYINDKCTGSVVGQQPFGGARGSGTNDKSGSMAYILKWMSWLSIKENFLPLNRHDYPYMSEN